MKKVIPNEAILIPKQAKLVFKGQIFDVYQWPQKLYDGTTATFERIKRPDTSVVIAVVEDKIIVIHEEQPDRGLSTTFPEGRVDPGEHPDAAAEREVREETGYQFKNFRLIKVWQPHSKLEWFIYLYLAWDVTDIAEQHLDAGEKISLELLSLEHVKQLVLDKSGYLGEAQDVLENINSIDELLQFPEFKGKLLET